MFEVLYCHSKFGGVQTSHATVGTKNVESFLSVSVSITILIDRVWENDFAQKVLELRSGFDIVGWGRLCTHIQVCLYRARWHYHGMSNLKMQLSMGFSPITSKEINWSVLNLTCKCTLLACFRVQNFAMIGKWELVYEPPQTLKIVQIYMVTHGYVS